jgi:hypothetical protein
MHHQHNRFSVAGKLILLCAFLTLFIGVAHAQDNLVGRIHEDKSNVAIPGINVHNLKNNKIVASDPTGAFSIPAKVGDIIVFSGFSYRSDTLYVQKLGYIDIVLTLSAKMLGEVKVTGSETRLGNLKAPPTLSPFGGDNLVYQSNAKGEYVGGVKLNVFDNNSAAKKRKKDVQVEKDERVKAKIADVFSAEGLKNYLDLKGQEMKNYITLYTPDIQTYTSPAFNMAFYVDSCYKEFQKIPADRRTSKELTELSPLH